MGEKAGDNNIGKVLLKCADCCLGCLECCLDKVSKNALIWTSIYGDAFCPSVCGSFMIIWANLFRMAVITFFSAIVTLLGKIMVPLFTTGICALILVKADKYADNMSSPVLPLIIIFLLSLAIAVLILEVYDAAIDVVFLAFLIDEKQNKSSGTMFADDGIGRVIAKYDVESMELAQKMTHRSTNPPPGAIGAKQKEIDMMNI